MKKVFLVLTLLLCTGFRGHEGNGGDYVEAFFIRKGQEILAVLYTSPDGHSLMNKYNISFHMLGKTLSQDVIQVRDAVLYDNKGREVDAIGEYGTIILSRPRWLSYIAENADVEQLVFHEMLRAAGVDDDHYLISAQIVPLINNSHFEFGHRLSNFINVEEIEFYLNGKILKNPSVKIRVDDKNSRLEIDLPYAPIESIGGQESRVVHQIRIPVFNRINKMITVERTDVHLTTSLSEKAELYLDRNITFTEGNIRMAASYGPVMANEMNFIIMDKFNLTTSYHEPLHFKTSLDLKDPMNDRPSKALIRRVIFYFKL